MATEVVEPSAKGYGIHNYSGEILHLRKRDGSKRYALELSGPDQQILDDFIFQHGLGKAALPQPQHLIDIAKRLGFLDDTVETVTELLDRLVGKIATQKARKEEGYEFPFTGNRAQLVANAMTMWKQRDGKVKAEREDARKGKGKAEASVAGPSTFPFHQQTVVKKPASKFPFATNTKLAAPQQAGSRPVGKTTPKLATRSTPTPTPAQTATRPRRGTPGSGLLPPRTSADIQADVEQAKNNMRDLVREYYTSKSDLAEMEEKMREMGFEEGE